MIGTTLGPYEITAKLGEGGMGEVFRATDTKLRRAIALKVLPQSPDRTRWVEARKAPGLTFHEWDPKGRVEWCGRGIPHQDGKG